MKKYLLLGTLIAIIPNYVFGYSARYNQLVAEKQQKMKELEDCTGNVKAWKIAGISTIGLTVVGIAGNVVLANKQSEYDDKIANAKKQIDSTQESIEKKELEIAQHEDERRREQNCFASGGQYSNGNCTCFGENVYYDGTRCVTHAPVITPQPAQKDPQETQKSDPAETNPAPEKANKGGGSSNPDGKQTQNVCINIDDKSTHKEGDVVWKSCTNKPYDNSNCKCTCKQGAWQCEGQKSASLPQHQAVGAPKADVQPYSQGNIIVNKDGQAVPNVLLPNGTESLLGQTGGNHQAVGAPKADVQPYSQGNITVNKDGQAVPNVALPNGPTPSFSEPKSKSVVSSSNTDVLLPNGTESLLGKTGGSKQNDSKAKYVWENNNKVNPVEQQRQNNGVASGFVGDGGMAQPVVAPSKKNDGKQNEDNKTSNGNYGWSNNKTMTPTQQRIQDNGFASSF